jgi:hypothetical protein
VIAVGLRVGYGVWKFIGGWMGHYTWLAYEVWIRHDWVTRRNEDMFL